MLRRSVTERDNSLGEEEEAGTKMTDYEEDKQGRGGNPPTFNKTMRQSYKAEETTSGLEIFFRLSI